MTSLRGAGDAPFGRFDAAVAVGPDDMVAVGGRQVGKAGEAAPEARKGDEDVFA
jgi:hypothetical protein